MTTQAKLAAFVRNLAHIEASAAGPSQEFLDTHLENPDSIITAEAAEELAQKIERADPIRIANVVGRIIDALKVGLPT